VGSVGGVVGWELVAVLPGVGVLAGFCVLSVEPPLVCCREIEGMLEDAGVLPAGLEGAYVPKIPNAPGQVEATGLVGGAVGAGVGMPPAGADCPMAAELIIAA
jgi:hypothetical protein